MRLVQHTKKSEMVYSIFLQFFLFVCFVGNGAITCHLYEACCKMPVTGVQRSVEGRFRETKQTRDSQLSRTCYRIILVQQNLRLNIPTISFDLFTLYPKTRYKYGTLYPPRSADPVLCWIVIVPTQKKTKKQFWLSKPFSFVTFTLLNNFFYIFWITFLQKCSFKLQVKRRPS